MKRQSSKLTVKGVIFALYFLGLTVVLVLALADVAFELGHGYSWTTVLGSVGLMVFGMILYAVTGWLHRVMFGD